MYGQGITKLTGFLVPFFPAFLCLGIVWISSRSLQGCERLVIYTQCFITQLIRNTCSVTFSFLNLWDTIVFAKDISFFIFFLGNNCHYLQIEIEFILREGPKKKHLWHAGKNVPLRWLALVFWSDRIIENQNWTCQSWFHSSLIHNHDISL